MQCSLDYLLRKSLMTRWVVNKYHIGIHTSRLLDFNFQDLRVCHTSRELSSKTIYNCCLIIQLVISNFFQDSKSPAKENLKSMLHIMKHAPSLHSLQKLQNNTQNVL